MRFFHPKRMISFVLMLGMLITMMPTSFGASVNSFRDFPNGWSKEAMTFSVDNGLLNGKSADLIKPKDNLTRAEMATVINRAFGATTKADVSRFRDIKSSDWYYNEVQKAVQMQTFEGDADNKFRPNVPITREEVMTVIARALVLESSDFSSISKFKDFSSISSWSKPYVSILISKGYVNGYEDGTVKPKANITREEFAQLMYNIFKTYISKEGMYNSVGLKGSVMINTPNVTLSDVTINGDLVIGDGVGYNPVRLNNVTIKGRLLARAGNITLKNVTTGEGVVVKNVNGTTNFNNYKSELVFAGVTEHTHVTYISSVNIGGGSGDGSSRKTKYTISFNTNWDGWIISDTKIKKGDKLTKPDVKERTGYTFDGWYTDEAFTQPYNFDEKVYSKFTLYAKWTPIEYTITYVLNGGTNPQNARVKYTISDETFDLPTPSRDNYMFGGWFTKPDFSDDRVNEITKGSTGNKTFYAKWTKIVNMVTIYFCDESGTIPVQWEDWTQFDIASAPKLTRDYYTFKEWNYASNGTGSTFGHGSIISGNTYVFAIWNPNVYNITYHLNGGTNPQNAPNQYVYSFGATLPTPTKDNCVFEGWYNNASFDGQPITKITSTDHDDKEFYAMWKENDVPPTPTYYTVQFKTNWADWTVSPASIKDGEKVTQPSTKSRNGYTFKGWYTDAAFNNSFDFDTPITKNTTLYAKWDADLYKITLNLNGGATSDGKTEIEYTIEDDVTLPTPTKDGFNFVGWFEDSEFNGPVILGYLKGTTGNKDLYAKWTNLPTYKVTFDYNYDNLTPYVVNIEEGKSFEDMGIELPKPTRENYTFEGWYKNSDGSGSEFTATEKIKSDIIVYADWKKIEYKVNFYYGYSQTNPNLITSQNVDIGKTFTYDELMQIYSDEGYVIKPQNGYKWRTQSNEIWPDFRCKDKDGKWVVFNSKLFKESLPVNGEMDVYLLTSYLNSYIKVPKLYDGLVMLGAPYSASERFMDSIKDAIYLSRPSVDIALAQSELDKRLYSALSGKTGLIDNEGYILNRDFSVSIGTIISESDIEKEFKKYVTKIINNGGEDLKNLLNSVDTDTIIKNVLDDKTLRELFIDNAIHNSEFVHKIVENDTFHDQIVSIIRDDHGDELIEIIHKDIVKAKIISLIVDNVNDFSIVAEEIKSTAVNVDSVVNNFVLNNSNKIKTEVRNKAISECIKEFNNDQNTNITTYEELKSYLTPDEIADIEANITNAQATAIQAVKTTVDNIVENAYDDIIEGYLAGKDTYTVTIDKVKFEYEGNSYEVNVNAIYSYKYRAEIDKAIIGEVDKYINDSLDLNVPSQKAVYDIIEDELIEYICAYLLDEIDDEDEINEVKDYAENVKNEFIVDVKNSFSDSVKGPIVRDIILSYVNVDNIITFIEYIKINSPDDLDMFIDNAFSIVKKLQYYKDFVYAVENNKKTLLVNKENIGFISTVGSAINELGTKDILDILKGKKLSALINIVGEDVIINIIDDAINKFTADIEAIKADIDADESYSENLSLSLNTNLNFVDIVNDIYDRYTAKLKNILTNKAPYYYNNNPYLKELVESDIFDTLLDFDSTKVSETNSGYKFKTSLDYYDIMYDKFNLLDNSLLWYGEISEDEYKKFKEELSSDIIVILNKVQEIIENIENGDAIIKDYTLNDIIDKVEDLNKVAEDNLAGKYSDTLKEIADTLVEMLTKMGDTGELPKGYTLDDINALAEKLKNKIALLPEGEYEKLDKELASYTTKAVNKLMDILVNYDKYIAKIEDLASKVSAIEKIYNKYSDKLIAIIDKFANSELARKYSDEDILKYMNSERFEDIITGKEDTNNILNVDSVINVALPILNKFRVDNPVSEDYEVILDEFTKEFRDNKIIIDRLMK